MWWKARNNKKTANTPNTSEQPATPALIQALEPRMMFDGAVAATVVDAAADHNTDSQPDSNDVAAPSAAGEQRQEVVFIDSNVQNYQQLVDGIVDGVEVVVLDGSQDGLQQIADYLDGRSGIDAIHILSHGSEGQVTLGSRILDSSSARDATSQLAAIGTSLNTDGDILIYGCDVAKDSGETLISTLAALTGADVAASNDATGSSTQGGDWELETHTGDIEPTTIWLNAAPDYDGLLATVNLSSSWLSNNADDWSITDNQTAGNMAGTGDSIYLDVQSQNLNPPDVVEFTISSNSSTAFNLDSLTVRPFINGPYQIEIYPTGDYASKVTSQLISGTSSQTVAVGLQNITSFTVRYVDSTDATGAPINLDFTSFSTSVAVANATPTASATGNNPTFVEQTSAADLFSGVTANTNDSGQTFSSAVFTVSNVTNGASESLTISGTSINLSNSNSGALSGGGSYSVSVTGSTATVTLSGLTRSDAQMATLIDGMTYANSSDDPGSATRTVTLTSVTDSGSSNNTSSLSLSSSVSVAPVNDAPTLSATGTSPTYTENASAVDLFSSVNISTLESGQNITGLTLTVSNLSDGASELLSIAGSEISLTDGTSGTTAGINYSVSVSAGVATLSLNTTGISAAVANSVIDGLAYRNSSDTPTAGNRTVTLTSLRDNGGVANGGSDTASLSVSSTVTVVPSNDAPAIGGLNGDSVAWAGVGNTVTLDAGSNATLSDAELSALNNWAGATLTLQRQSGAVSSDVFGFDISGALFSVSGNALQDSGQTFATFSQSGGVLTITFNSSQTNASTTLVNDVMRHVTYRNDTPAGDATLRITLTDDGAAVATADVSVTSDTIYVTNTTDTAVIDPSNGVSLSEAIAIAAADTTGTQTLVFDSSFAGQNISINATTLTENLTFDLGQASGATFSGGALTLNSGVTLTIQNDSGDTVTFNNAIDGNGNLAKTGAGTLILGGSNSYAGTTELSAGSLQISSDSNLGSGSVTLADSTVLQLSDFITIDNAFVLVGTANVVLSNASTFSGDISGSGNLVKQGSSNLTLSGTNTYSGTTTVTSGYLIIGNDNNLGSGTLTLEDAAALGITGAGTLDNAIVMSGTSAIIDTGANTTISGIISGTGRLTKIGAGELTLTASNTYSGGTMVWGGALGSAADNSLGSGQITLQSGTTLDVTGGSLISNDILLSGTGTSITTSVNLTISGVISGSNSLTKSGNGTLTLSGTNTYTGATTIASGGLSISSTDNISSGTISIQNMGRLIVDGSTTLTNSLFLAGANSSVSVGSGDSLTLSGVVSGTGSLIKADSGTLTLSGSNTYSGATVINGGTLSIAGDGNLGTGNLQFQDGTLRITGAGTIDNAIVLGAGLFVNTIETTSDTSLSGAISGSGDVFKTGSGTLTLSASNSATGMLTASAGTVLINGSYDGQVSAQSAGTVGGTGTLNGLVSIFSGGTLAAGSSPGSLTINGNLQLETGSTLAVDISGTTAGTEYDQLIVNGTVTINNATLSVNLGSYTPPAASSFTIISNDGVDAISGSFSGLAEGSTVGGTTLSLSYAGADGNDFTLSAPASAAPVIGNLDGDSVTFTQGGGAALLDASGDATLSDVDSPDFDGGSLTVSVTGNAVPGEDLLDIRNQGTGAGLIGIAGSDVTYGGITIGTFSGGNAGADLQISLNSNANALAVQALLQNLTYRNSNASNAIDQSDRTVRILVSDGDGAQSVGAQVTVSVVETVPPTATITVASGGVLGLNDTSSVTIEFSEAVTDLDVNDFTVANGTLSGLTSSDGGVTWNATLTVTGVVEDVSNVITLNNAGVQDLAGNAGVGTTDSNNYEIDAVAPINSLPAAQNTDTQTALVFSSANGNAISVSDGTDVQVVVSTNNGTLTAIAGGSATVVGNGSASVTISGSSAAVNAALEGLRYLAGSAGNQTITIQSTDAAGNTDTDSVAVTVAGSTLLVTSDQDSGADGTNATSLEEDSVDGNGLSIREALFWAKSGDTITFDLDSSSAGYQGGSITLNGTQLEVTRGNITIDGDLNDDGVADITLSANNLSRVMNVGSGLAGIALDGLTLTAGQAFGGGALFIGTNTSLLALNSNFTNSQDIGSGGGGIFGSSTTLTLINSTVSGNTGSSFGGGIRIVGTGSILRIFNSTISNNATTGAGSHGGGIQYAGPELLLVNTTISGNAALGAGSLGGGLRITSGVAQVYNSTIVGNAAASDGGGVSANGTETFVNTVVAGNTAGAGATAASGGSALASGGNANDVAGVIETAISSYFGGNASIQSNTASLTNQGTGSLLLGNLAFNDGGTVQTHKASTGSALIDAGSNTALPADTADLDNDSDTSERLPVDANGQLRVIGTVDIGAVEFGGPNIITSGGSSSFVEGANVASSPVTVDPALTLSDPDSPTLPSATVSITGGFQSGQDLLAFTNDGSTMGNISGSFNAATGQLTLTSAGSTASLAQWQAALRSVTYSNSSDTPSTADRTVSFVINDGSSDSSAATRVVTVTASNDSPVNNMPGSQNVDQDAVLTFNSANGNALSISDVDAGTGSMEVSLTATNGVLSLGTTAGLTFSVGNGIADASMTLSGTLADINNALNGLTFSPTTGFNGAAAFQITTSDLGNTGSGGAQTDTDTISITVDPIEPVVTSVSSTTANGTYGIGDVVTVTVSFDQAVTVNTSGGNPSLLLETGAVDRAISYVSGSGTDTLTFSYTVQAGDQSADLDYASTSALSLNGATIRSASNRDAVLTLPAVGSADSLGGQSSLVVDGVRPTASITIDDSALSVGETATVTITFTEAVTGLDVADFTVANGSLSGLTSSDGGITWTATLTPNASVESTSNLIALNNSGYTDIAGNGGTGTTNSGNYSVDTARPTASIDIDDNALSLGETATVTITFSEAVSGLDVADFTVANGALSDLTSSDGGITWTATLTPTAGTEDSTNVITLNNSGYTDGAGNTGTGSTNSANYSIDTLRPTASINIDDTALAAGETTTVTITFSEAVSSLDVADFTVANGSLSDLTSSDGGITWTATLTPTASTADSTNVITLNNTGYTDGAGNTGTGTTDSSNYSIDTLRPTASITIDDSALSVGETATVTVTFSEAVTGLDVADFTVANGTLSGLTSSDGGITWTAALTPDAGVDSASNLIALNNTGYTDIAGNSGTGTTDSGSYSIDTVRPSASIAVDDTALRAGETATVTVTFSEAVTGLDVADFTVANGSLSDLTSSDGGITWTATLTPDASVESASNLIALNNTGYTDIAGNSGTGTTDSNNYAVDTLRPTTSIAIDDSALSVGETATVTITFTEAVTGLDVADFTVANGSLSGLTTSDGGITWTATLTPDANVESASNLIALNNTGYTDIAGNSGTGTTDSNNYAVDTLRPTTSIAIDDSALSVGETATVTITFTEAVTGLDVADFTVANGTLSGLTSSDGGITWTATLTPDAGVESASNLIALNNTGYTDIAGNSGTGTTNSGNYSVDTARPTASIDIDDSALRVGDTATVTVTFSEAVSGLDVADFTVANGALSDLTTSDGGITWTATLTPTASTEDSTNVITLNNSGYTDGAGNTGTGTTDSSNYAVDTLRPTASITIDDSALSVGETATVTITFTEAVTGLDVADFTVANGTLSGLTSSDGGITWTATLTPDASVESASNLIALNNTGYTDIAGNSGTGTTNSSNYSVDTARPTASIDIDDSALSEGETATVTITFSEAVSGLNVADFTVANGALSDLTSSDGGITWTATLTPTAGTEDSTNVITLNNGGYTDGASNTGTGTTDSSNYAIDTLRPTASIAIDDSALSAGETATVTITFSEEVSGLDEADFSVANGALSNLTSSNGGITWTATLTPTADIEDTSNLVTLDNTGVQDAAGNTGTGTTDSNNYTIDTLRPTASIVVADTALAAGETSTVTITFNEAVSGLTTADLSVENGALSNLTSSDGGTTWTATLTPTADIEDTSNLVTLDNTGVQDAAGNTGTGTTASNAYAIDTLRPTASITVADTALAAGETTTVTISFSEVVSGLDVADFTVANGTLSGLTTSDGGLTWTATLVPSANVDSASNLISLNNTGYTDAAGNTGNGSTDSNNYAIDNLRPTASITVADTALAAGETTTVTISFSEVVSGLDVADFTVANGTLSGLTTSDGGLTWTATLVPSANVDSTSSLISLNNTGYSDAAGNTGTGTTDSNAYAIDTLRPTASITVADTALAAGETTTVTIAFSEAVSGLDVTDFSVTNGALSDLTTSDGGLTWTATLTPSANVDSASNLIALNNTGYTDAAGNTGTGSTNSNGYAIDTLRPTASITVADSALAAGETTTATITFSEAIMGLDVADFTVANGTLSDLTTSDGGLTWTATLTPSANVEIASNLITLNNTGYTDAAGNTGTGTTNSGNYSIDTLRPTASIAIDDSALSVGETTTVTISFSEVVSGLDVADFTVANGVLSDLTTSDGGLTWTATLSPTTNAESVSNLISLNNTGYTDAAGNTGTGSTDSNNYAIDTLRPTASIAIDDSALSVGETTTVTISFSEVVSGLDVADFTVANGVLSDLTTSDGGLTWIATLTPSVNVESASNLITLNNTGYSDAAGNTGTGTTDSGNYSIDTLRPTANIVIDDTTLAASEATTVTISFSEAVTGLDIADFTVANGSLSDLVTVDGGLTWTAILTPDSNIEDNNNVVTLNNTGYIDDAGNTGTGTTDSGNYSVDTLRPSSSITIDDTALNVGETATVTISFSEAVTGLDVADFTVANGTLSNLTSSDGGITWTATLTPTSNIEDSSNIVTLNNTGYTDAAGNTGTGTTDSGNYSIDTLPPTISDIALDGPSPTNANSVSFTVTFSETVSGVDLGDFALVTTGNADGNLSSLTQIDAQTWQVTVTEVSGLGSLGLAVNAAGSGITDSNGNAMVADISVPGYDIIAANHIPDPGTGTPDTPFIAPPPTAPQPPPALLPPPTVGNGLSLNDPFINPTPMQISLFAQVFSARSANGFLGFGGGDAGVFGRSTLADLFKPGHSPFDILLERSGGAFSLQQQLRLFSAVETERTHQLSSALKGMSNNTQQS